MTLLVQLNTLSQAYCLFKFLLEKLFTSFTYFFLSDCPSGFVLLKLFIQYGHESIIA